MSLVDNAHCPYGCKPGAYRFGCPEHGKQQIALPVASVPAKRTDIDWKAVLEESNGSPHDVHRAIEMMLPVFEEWAESAAERDCFVCGLPHCETGQRAADCPLAHISREQAAAILAQLKESR